MQQHTVQIEETLSKYVTVTATSEKHAVQRVKEMYNDAEIVLDYNDITDTSFEIIPN